MHIRNHGWRKFIFIILISALLIAEYGPTVVFAKKNSFSEEIIIEDLQLSDSRDQFALMEESQPGLNPETDSQKQDAAETETPENQNLLLPTEEIVAEPTLPPELTESLDPVPTETPVSADQVSEETESETAALFPIVENDRILLYHAEQLFLIGTNQPVTTMDYDPQFLGTGKNLNDENGMPLLYSNDAHYVLMNDIPLPQGQIWLLPEPFTGTFEDGAQRSEMTVYDSQTQIIYIYHPYQLLTIASQTAAEEPVMSLDYDAAQFGMGQCYFTDSEATAFLTYSPDHPYVLASSFNPEYTQPLAEQITLADDTRTSDGRDFEGQVYKEIDGIKYILIGNAQQLQAIGSDRKVYGKVWQNILNTLKYDGDADIAADQSLFEPTLFISYYGQNQTTGAPDQKSNADVGLTYSINANYIIFRDIDLQDKPWTPISFSGTLIGAKANGTDKIWNDDLNRISESVQQPVISNINVTQSGELDTSKIMGIGFFSTITNEINVENVGVSAGTVRVSNIALSKISVNNQSQKVKNTDSIINFLLTNTGWLVGSLISGILNIITLGNVKLNLGDLLKALLNARAADPSAFATGAFAGRIIGDVVISDCVVDGAEVTNVMDRTGSFVGHVEGVTQYSGLSTALGTTVDLLTSLLNAIPGLGLGDLITVLLNNSINVANLIPTGYINPRIERCEVKKLTGSIGTSGKKFNGGFAGIQIGTIIQDCRISDSAYTVTADEYGGGFVGLCRDAEIKGLLTEVGIDLIRLMKPQSLILNSQLENCSIAVEGTNYLGGFAGAMANSYAVNASIRKKEDSAKNIELKVNSSGSNVGGFAGTATVGWITNLGSAEKTENSLLSVVKDLLSAILNGSNPETAQMLLTLVGANPSALLGCQIDVDAVIVEAQGDYAGGLVGSGDGLIVAESRNTYIQEISFAKYAIDSSAFVSAISAQQPLLSGLVSVKAENYAGGIIGDVKTASAAGLVNNTLGLGNFLPFTLQDITVKGVEAGYTIAASEEYAGGAVGEAIGGSIQNVSLEDAGAVSAASRVGGFAGLIGPGDLAGTGGLEINLLGIPLLKASNLLSVGQALGVEILNCHTVGIPSGMTVRAAGLQSPFESTAGGFAAQANSAKIHNASVSQLDSVTADFNLGIAGGFVGKSVTGGLAEVSDKTELSGIINAGNLISAVEYMIPQYEDCTVGFVGKSLVEADIAGGFTGDFQSGKVNNTETSDTTAVRNLSEVHGGRYAGGFGGKVTSGALASSSGGVSILGILGEASIKINDLLGVIEAYVPIIKQASVQSSETGLIVIADRVDDTDSDSGSAGGFIGYGSGVQVTSSHVNKLKHTIVTPPEKLESSQAPEYFDPKLSAYSVTGARYAGGYIGNMDVGSAASVGESLKVLGSSLSLKDVLGALAVVVSTIEHSSVTGQPGGFSVLASNVSDSGVPAEGMAGGFAGIIQGGHIQDSSSYNFAYIVGQRAAGGYVGNMEPGSVAKVLESTEILKGLVSVGGLASVAEDFVPTIRNSAATCIPCGGVVRAQAPAINGIRSGVAGGYAGRSAGGQIWGLNKSAWKNENDENQNYTGPVRTCSTDRILSVYGAEIAGGFTGLMECADTAEGGNLSLLYGLVNAENLFDALSIVYPTEENTEVSGPLSKLDLETWNTWVDYVGIYGGFGSELAENGKFVDQETLDKNLSRYLYGYHVAAGRSEISGEIIASEGGSAGGYVGAMHSGVITNGQAKEVKQVSAMRTAGGYAGEMLSGGAASLGSVSILGLNLNLGQMIKAVEVFVPTIKSSSVRGYQSGLMVAATGVDPNAEIGHAGGYVGFASGGQIWGDVKNEQNSTGNCDVLRLRAVKGTRSVGGYVGKATSAAAASVSTQTSDGLLQKLLDALIKNTSDLTRILEASMTTIRQAKVSAADEAFGFVVEGQIHSGGYARSAGGFAGTLEAAVLGDRHGDTRLCVENLRGVIGGNYAGGFFGLADVGSVASVSGNDTTEGKTSILEFIQAGEVSVLDAFRSYIYSASVQGISEGFIIRAYTEDTEGTLDSKRLTGNAGGFGGGLLNGSVKNSSVTSLSSVSGLNYVGGFIGHLGKNGAVDVDRAQVAEKLNLLNATAGLFDICGSHVESCTVTGIPAGYTVTASSPQAIAGGFSGYADLSRIYDCHSELLKKVTSANIAGGFVGKTDMNFVGNIQISSSAVNVLLMIVNALLKILYLNELENIDLIKIDFPPIEELKLFNLHLLTDGDLLYVNLLGLKIGVALVKKSGTDPGTTDVAIITIGDSTIKLPCTQEGVDRSQANLDIQLIKGNRTNLINNQVSGIHIGYDVFGAGASDLADGINLNGYSGGFVGYNNEGLLEDNRMTYCDTVRGYGQANAPQVGPFTGTSVLKTVYDNYNMNVIEGKGNIYSIYRKLASTFNLILGIDSIIPSEDDATYQRYDLSHYTQVESYDDLKNAKLTDNTTTIPLEAYVSPAKAVLMLDTPVIDNSESLLPEPGEVQNPCNEYIEYTIQKIWKDWGNWDHLRPEEIQVMIYQSYENADGTIQKKLYAADNFTNPFTLSAESNGSSWSATWKTTEGQIRLPVAFEQDGKIYYYSYTVEEVPVSGYTSTIKYDTTGYIATITNRHDPKLPLTGGPGGIALAGLGTVMILAGLESKRRTKKRKKRRKRRRRRRLIHNTKKKSTAVRNQK